MNNSNTQKGDGIKHAIANILQNVWQTKKTPLSTLIVKCTNYICESTEFLAHFLKSNINTQTHSGSLFKLNNYFMSIIDINEN